jgi:hypothetical protein
VPLRKRELNLPHDALQRSHYGAQSDRGDATVWKSYASITACILLLWSVVQPGVLRAAPRSTARLTCPHSLRPDSGSPGAVIAAVHKAAPHLLAGPGEKPYHIVYLASLYPQENGYADGFIRTAKEACGPTVAFHSWVVIVVFPYWIRLNRSAARAEALLFVAHTAHGWVVWHREP